MTILIIIFASLIMLAGVVLLVNPETIFGFLRNNTDSTAIHVVAIITRLIIGALLIAQSSLSRFPLGIEVVGWIFIVAGLTLAIMGRNNFRKLISWVLTKFKPFGRLAGVIAIAFGGFLVYAFL